MNCPRCVAALVEWDTGKGHKAEGCQRCKGVFLAMATIRANALRPHALEPHLTAPLIEARESFIKCPACGGQMRLGGMIQTDLRVDRCEACFGIWFDAGEIDRFFELTAALPATSETSLVGVLPKDATAKLKVPSQRVPVAPARSAFRAYLVVLILIATAIGFYFKNPFR